ncbi:hypothetical protein HMPREF9714_00403 [Myroides odoratimimus CCUG 12901]|uniref:TlpA family protein disulfide reductase n=1 Tax=Myroides odoratimimus TaxID=76832 RepID=UPI0002460D3A|nr:redoxin domain-containing protein [Myroides odoratimimus]EHO14573.1 hypothetical protein HMPREF9714_00403 [Myroides odoratimimus CCUG 12901]
MTNKLMMLIALFFSIGIMAQDKLHITGKITGIPNEAKLTLENNFKKVVFQLKDGVLDVEMELTVVPTLVFMMVEHEGKQKYTTFFVGNEAIVLNGSIEDFPNNIKAENSKYDELRYQEHLLTKELNDKIEILSAEARTMIEEGAIRDSVYKMYMNNVEPLGKITKIIREIEQKSADFIKDNINTDYGRYSLRYCLSQFTPEEIREIAPLIDPKYKNTEEVRFVYSITDSNTLEEGDKYYDFIAKDINQKQVRFSDYFKGKYVLLDFSTLHCGYCQEAAPKTAQIAEELKDQLTYVTYYVDHDIEGLHDYYKLKKDRGNLIWNNGGRLEPNLGMYRQNGTPHYMLFDTKGKLVKDFLGMQGEDFEEQLRALMK